MLLQVLKATMLPPIGDQVTHQYATSEIITQTSYTLNTLNMLPMILP